MLNTKQELFIQNIISGMTQRQAYKEAYKAKYTDKAIDEKACVLFNSEKVQERYRELLAKLEEKAVMTAFEKRRILRDMAYDSDVSAADRIKAIDTDNKMAGEYVTKIEGNIKMNKLEDLI